MSTINIYRRSLPRSRRAGAARPLEEATETPNPEELARPRCLGYVSGEDSIRREMPAQRE